MCFSVKHALPSRSDVEVTSEDDFGLLEELFNQTLDHVDDKKKKAWRLLLLLRPSPVNAWRGHWTIGNGSMQ